MTGSNGFTGDTLSDVNGLLILLASVLAVAGPTSQDVVQKLLTPRVPYAVATALLLFYITLQVASDGYTEFLYFQF